MGGERGIFQVFLFYLKINLKKNLLQLDIHEKNLYLSINRLPDVRKVEYLMLYLIYQKDPTGDDFAEGAHGRPPDLILFL